MQFKKNNPNTDLIELEMFEKQWGINLPDVYKMFLLKNNGGRPLRSMFPLTGFNEEAVENVHTFFGIGTTIKINDLNWRIVNRIAPFPADLLEIACTEGGDLICINTKSKTSPVYFFDQRPSANDGVWHDGDLYLLSHSFSDFLARLEVKSTLIYANLV